MPEEKKGSFRGLVAVIVCVLVVAALGTGFVFWHKHRKVKAESSRLAAEQSKGRKVLVAQVKMPDPERMVTLPGDVRPFVEVGVFPKVNGYLRTMKVDKGDHVKAGQVLATIESPETDQQVAAARSALRLRQVTAARVRRLGPTGFVSRQDLDNANEGLRSAQADYRRTLALQAYEVLRAPFAGIVTQRNVDPGALVSASSTAPLLQIADPKRLRVWVYVAQDVAPYLHAGDPADIAADERPGHLLHAQVSRIAEALDSRTRTMLAEVWLDNSEGSLVSGVFVHVTLHVRIPPLPVVPSNAILSRGEKTLVAVVVAQDKLHLTPVETGLDDGKMVQVRTGLRGNETVALDVPSELGEGAVIQPLQPGQVKKGGQPQAREGTAPKRDGKQAKDGKGNAQQDGKDGNQGR